MFYVVFARICDIKGMASDGIAGAVERLAQLDPKLRVAYPAVKTFSSVYGRFWIVPKSVRDAIGSAKAILDIAAASGVRLCIGVTVGRIESTQDLLAENVAGVPINHAARLAFLEGNEGHIAVDEEVVDYAVEAGPMTKTCFSDLQTGRVKRTELRYRWLDHQSPLLGEAPTSEATETLAHVVVYDIVSYSEKAQEDMVQSVEGLRHAVRRSLEAAGLVQWADDDGLWYAPAGDGGVVVFGAERGRAAWTFAKALLDHTADKVHVRVGVATGVVVVVSGSLPVGKGVLKADRLSGLAEEGQPCVSNRFWKALENFETREWTSIPNNGESESCLVQRKMSKRSTRQWSYSVNDFLIDEALSNLNDYEAETPRDQEKLKKIFRRFFSRAAFHSTAYEEETRYFLFTLCWAHLLLNEYLGDFSPAGNVELLQEIIDGMDYLKRRMGRMFGRTFSLTKHIDSHIRDKDVFINTLPGPHILLSNQNLAVRNKLVPEVREKLHRAGLLHSL